MIKVLLATNDSVLERMIEVTLTINGLSVTSVTNLTDVITRMHSDDYHILLHDKSYADIGLIVRGKGFHTPILSLGTMSGPEGLKDLDHLSDPFDFSALRTKMNGMLKKRFTLKEKVIVNGNLKIDMINQFAMIKDEVISLGKVEFAILVSLARKAGTIVSKEKLMIDLEAQGQFFNTAIYHHIKGLKRKLKDELNIKCITGIGYQLVNEN